MIKTSIGLLSDQEINDTKIILNKIFLELKNINGDPPYRLELFFDDFPISSGFIDISRINKIIDLLHKNDVIFFEKPFITPRGDRGIHITIPEDKQKIISLYNEIEKIPVSRPKTKAVILQEETVDNKSLITRDGRGNYYYDGVMIKMDQDTHCYKLFDILFNKKDQFGFVSYEDIDEEFVKKGEKKIYDPDKRRKRILNAYGLQLFRFAKVNGKKLINLTPDGHELVRIKKGKGLILYNQNLD